MMRGLPIITAEQRLAEHRGVKAAIFGKPGSGKTWLLRTLMSSTTLFFDLEAGDLAIGEPPAFNRRYLESRLAYRIQELAYGGLKPETIRRLEALGEQLDGGKIAVRKTRADERPIAGTRLIREWQGVEHTVTVMNDGYEWQGRPYKSLSAIARAIAGSRWNGWVFFGLKNTKAKP